MTFSHKITGTYVNGSLIYDGKQIVSDQKGMRYPFCKYRTFSSIAETRTRMNVHIPNMAAYQLAHYTIICGSNGIRTHLIFRVTVGRTHQASPRSILFLV